MGNAITVLDLFAGAGGLTQGMHEASSRFDVVRAVEKDRDAAATFALNHGEGITFQGGIEDWLQDEVVPSVDIVVGGPPCQGFSTLGKQNVEDERNTLWREYAETIIRAQPKYFVLENVAVFAKSPQFRALTESTESNGILRDYSFEWDVLNAADFGTPQARRRAILIGRHRDMPETGLPKPSHHRDEHISVGEAFSGISHGVGLHLDDRRVKIDGRDHRGWWSSRELHVGRDYADISLRRFAEIPPGGNRFDLPDELLAPCWRKHKSGSGDVMGRLHLDKPSVTIRTEFFKPEKGRYLHPFADRAITHYEAAVLQGFPVDYRFAGSRTAIARQIGNAVPIPLGRAIGNLLADALI
ncbi:Cytosine-specific methyltransferase [Microbacterium sp. Nx66]|uniref:DNA cytosine methyltransferase n=1 Tax=unclassified Microbacterium TaxID=2609290 RepID=UPI00157678BA|nr:MULTISPECIES: DNA cytosine methyltransferase [unclassified Microbacterium]CAD5137704.1 Cytosine-specific methyltransferase [Microbacterium sp. Nx66]